MKAFSVSGMLSCIVAKDFQVLGCVRSVDQVALSHVEGGGSLRRRMGGSRADRSLV